MYACVGIIYVQPNVEWNPTPSQHIFIVVAYIERSSAIK